MRELKPGWRRVKFGEVVRQVKDRVAPETSGLKRFVAGEHMHTDDLRIRHWGDIGEGYLGPAFNMRFQPGQVLYGSRRTYLRKVAVADFEGICSNTTFVLESADHNVLVPKILPFVMQSEAFHEHSRRESKGSVNPYVNFSDLAWYEFALPPTEEQQRIAKALTACMATEEALRDLAAASKALLDSAVLDAFGSVRERASLQSFCRDPITYGIVQAGPDLENGIPYIRVSEMTGRDYLDPSVMKKTSSEISAAYQRTILELNDIVVALRGVPGLSHICGKEMVGSNLSRGVARIAPSDEVNPRFLLWALRSPQIQAAILQYANGWKGEDLREITIGQLRELQIPVPPRSDQDIVADRLDVLHGVWTASRVRLLGFTRNTFASIRTTLLEVEK